MQKVEAGRGFCYPVANLQEGIGTPERMTQGAVKTTGKRSRAVSAKKKAILSAALDTFSQFGFHGTRLEQIAELAGVSKTNLLYYFPSKEALYIAVLRQILDIWLAPLKAFREDFAPLAAIKEYIRLKLEVSRDYPQASRLFCMEMLAGAPLLMDELTGDLKALIDEKSALIAGWVKSGKLAPIDPQHLIFTENDLGFHSTLRRFCPSGGGGDRRDVAR
ncbi:transcriptional regulator [Escherichia coli]|uniref:Transcriptional regulator n=1 Tax=Escherichia coli TaxID=562 RepID=A0A8S0FYT1_ECOLX|nr:transcriptional regulator [Escherichia coli]